RRRLALATGPAWLVVPAELRDGMLQPTLRGLQTPAHDVLRPATFRDTRVKIPEPAASRRMGRGVDQDDAGHTVVDQCSGDGIVCAGANPEQHEAWDPI